MRPIRSDSAPPTAEEEIEGLDDSKALSAKQREALEPVVKMRAVAWAVAFASVEEIGEMNILRATGLAMRRAVEALTHAPAFALVDGNYPFRLPCPVKTVVKGDAISASIAAASILAKTARDRLMEAMDAAHPGYGFAAGSKRNSPPEVKAGGIGATISQVFPAPSVRAKPLGVTTIMVFSSLKNGPKSASTANPWSSTSCLCPG